MVKMKEKTFIMIIKKYIHLFRARSFVSFFYFNK